MRVWRLAIAAAVGLLATTAGTARAQIGVVVSAASDYRYRGVSFSEGAPEGSIAVAWDDPGGVYAGAEVMGDSARGGRLLGHMEYLGYAKRVGGDVTLDLGATNIAYRPAYGGSADNPEVYLGLRKGVARLYAYYSPRYFTPGVKTLYLAADAGLPLARRWRLFGHLGLLETLTIPYGQAFGSRFDGKAGVGVNVLGGEVQLAWTTRRSEPSGPVRIRAGNALVVSVSRGF